MVRGVPGFTVSSESIKKSEKDKSLRHVGNRGLLWRILTVLRDSHGKFGDGSFSGDLPSYFDFPAET